MAGCLIPHTPIAVDYWKKRDIRSKVCFLSHMHTDHTQGLTSSWNQVIFCSEITRSLAIEQLNIQPSLLVTIPVGQSTIIPLDDAGVEKMTVTLIDANHCGGAVMFLFQGYFGCILHTGDFRYFDGMLDIPQFTNGIVINTLYLDNTYCDPKCEFPTRAEAKEKILEIILNNPEKDIRFGLDMLGKEDLLCDIAKNQGFPIFVDEFRYKTAELLGYSEYFTLNQEETYIRAEKKSNVNRSSLAFLNKICPTIGIIPSALYQGRDNPFAKSGTIFVVPYSDHSSFSELKQFVAKLKPQRIIPIVGKKNKEERSHDRADMTIFAADMSSNAGQHVFDVPLTVQAFMSRDLSRNINCGGKKRKASTSYFNGRSKRAYGIVFSPGKQVGVRKDEDQMPIELDPNITNRSEADVQENEKGTDVTFLSSSTVVNANLHTERANKTSQEETAPPKEEASIKVRDDSQDDQTQQSSEKSPVMADTTLPGAAQSSSEETSEENRDKNSQERTAPLTEQARTNVKDDNQGDQTQQSSEKSLVMIDATLPGAAQSSSEETSEENRGESSQESTAPPTEQARTNVKEDNQGDQTHKSIDKLIAVVETTLPGASQSISEEKSTKDRNESSQERAALPAEQTRTKVKDDNQDDQTHKCIDKSAAVLEATLPGSVQSSSDEKSNQDLKSFAERALDTILSSFWPRKSNPTEDHDDESLPNLKTTHECVRQEQTQRDGFQNKLQVEREEAIPHATDDERMAESCPTVSTESIQIQKTPNSVALTDSASSNGNQNTSDEKILEPIVLPQGSEYRSSKQKSLPVPTEMQGNKESPNCSSTVTRIREIPPPTQLVKAKIQEDNHDIEIRLSSHKSVAVIEPVGITALPVAQGTSSTNSKEETGIVGQEANAQISDDERAKEDAGDCEKTALTKRQEEQDKKIIENKEDENSSRNDMPKPVAIRANDQGILHGSTEGLLSVSLEPTNNQKSPNLVPQTEPASSKDTETSCVEKDLETVKLSQNNEENVRLNKTGKFPIPKELSTSNGSPTSSHNNLELNIHEPPPILTELPENHGSPTFGQSNLQLKMHEQSPTPTELLENQGSPEIVSSQSESCTSSIKMFIEMHEEEGTEERVLPSKSVLDETSQQIEFENCSDPHKADPVSSNLSSPTGNNKYPKILDNVERLATVAQANGKQSTLNKISSAQEVDKPQNHESTRNQDDLKVLNDAEFSITVSEANDELIVLSKVPNTQEVSESQVESVDKEEYPKALNNPETSINIAGTDGKQSTPNRDSSAQDVSESQTNDSDENEVCLNILNDTGTYVHIRIEVDDAGLVTINNVHSTQELSESQICEPVRKEEYAKVSNNEETLITVAEGDGKRNNFNKLTNTQQVSKSQTCESGGKEEYPKLMNNTETLMEDSSRQELDKSNTPQSLERTPLYHTETSTTGKAKERQQTQKETSCEFTYTGIKSEREEEYPNVSGRAGTHIKEIAHNKGANPQRPSNSKISNYFTKLVKRAETSIQEKVDEPTKGTPSKVPTTQKSISRESQTHIEKITRNNVTSTQKLSKYKLHECDLKIELEDHQQLTKRVKTRYESTNEGDILNVEKCAKTTKDKRATGAPKIRHNRALNTVEISTAEKVGISTVEQQPNVWKYVKIHPHKVHETQILDTQVPTTKQEPSGSQLCQCESQEQSPKQVNPTEAPPNEDANELLDVYNKVSSIQKRSPMFQCSGQIAYPKRMKCAEMAMDENTDNPETSRNETQEPHAKRRKTHEANSSQVINTQVSTDQEPSGSQECECDCQEECPKRVNGAETPSNEDADELLVVHNKVSGIQKRSPMFQCIGQVAYPKRMKRTEIDIDENADNLETVDNETQEPHAKRRKTQSESQMSDCDLQEEHPNQVKLAKTHIDEKADITQNKVSTTKEASGSQICEYEETYLKVMETPVGESADNPQIVHNKVSSIQKRSSILGCNRQVEHPKPALLMETPIDENSDDPQIIHNKVPTSQTPSGSACASEHRDATNDVSALKTKRRKPRGIYTGDVSFARTILERWIRENVKDGEDGN